MSQQPNSNQSLREQLSGVVTAIATCRPGDSAATAEIHRRLVVLSEQVEREQVDELAPLCKIALRTADLLNADGRVETERVLELVEALVRHVWTTLEVEGKAQELRTAAAAAVAELPEPKCTALRQRVVLNSASEPKGLQLVSAKKLGELMVQLSMLTPLQVESALAQQRVSGCRFGEALIQLKILPRDAVENAIRMQRSRSNWASDGWTGSK